MSESDFLDLPELTLDPPADFSDSYEWDGASGVWRLSQAAKDFIAEAKQNIEATKKEFWQRGEALKAAIDAERVAHRNEVIDWQLAAALKHAGAITGLIPAAIKLLRSEDSGFAFKVTAKGDGHAVTVNGERLSHAVERWLGDAGSCFADAKKRQQRKGGEAGPFTQMLRDVTG
jgi:hypothetical protein